MITDKARNIVSTIPAGSRPVLFNAFKRYMEFTGVWKGETVNQKQVAADRAAYTHLLIDADKGAAAISSLRCGEFMASVSKLPLEWGLAWAVGEIESERSSYALDNVEILEETEGMYQ